MKPLTREWVEKAEGDWRTARREWRARNQPNYDALCFHLQQCLEKYLKARLQEAGIAFEKTHNLNSLLDLAIGVEPLWGDFRTGLAVVSEYAVAYRYPGESADKAIASEAMKIGRSLRREMRGSLGLHE